MPSGTSTMPSAVSSPVRGSSSDAPIRISSSAVSGLATGIRIRAGSGSPLTGPCPAARRRGRGRPRASSARQRSTRYGLSSSNSRAWRSTRSSASAVVDVPVLDHEAADAPEVDRHERRDQLRGVQRRRGGSRGPGRRSRAPTGRRGSGSWPAPRPSRASPGGRSRPRRPCRACATRRRPAARPPSASASTASAVRRVQHRGARCRPGSASPPWNSDEQADRVHLERRRVDDPLEAVGRDVVAALDVEPGVGVRRGEPQDRAHDLAEHRARGPRPGPWGRGPWRPGASGRPRTRRSARTSSSRCRCRTC